MGNAQPPNSCAAAVCCAVVHALVVRPMSNGIPAASMIARVNRASHANRRTVSGEITVPNPPTPATSVSPVNVANGTVTVTWGLVPRDVGSSPALSPAASKSRKAS